MVYILTIGSGGGGGSGVIGAASSAAGGAGGGSGGMSTLLIPAFALPDVLYVTAGAAKPGNGIASRVSVYPNSLTNDCVLLAQPGLVGGNASGATAGTGGAGGTIGSFNDCNLIALGVPYFNSGQAGRNGGSTGAGVDIPLPTTGLTTTGGCGGAGLGAGGAAGSIGGSRTLPSPPSRFPAQAGGAGGSSATTPPGNGSHGYTNFVQGLLYGYGGSGGGSTHGSATGAGLVQARGGDGGGYGCGGGGMGGALTGSTPAVASLGGAGYVLIISW